jgi:iron complex outermembrane receptor protein
VDDDSVSYKSGGFEFDASGGAGLSWIISDIVELELPVSYTWKNIESDDSYSFFGSRAHTAEFRPQLTASLNSIGIPLRILGGVDFYYVNMDMNSYASIQHTGDPFNSAVSEFTLGPYVSARFNPLPRLTLTAGARFDAAFLSANKNQPVDESNSNNWNAFVYDAGIAFQPLDAIKVYARYATIFRYPFTDELISWYGTSVDYYNTALEPEKGFNAEGGISIHIGKFLNLDGNVYYMKLEDEVDYGPNPNAPPAQANINMDTTQRIGTNISLTAKPFDFLELQGSYSYVDATFVEGDNKGKRIPLVPEHTIYGALLVKFPLGLSFGPDLEYRSSRFFGSDIANAGDTLDAYTLLGLRARYVLDKQGQQWALQLTVKNLLDTHYATYAYYTDYYPENYYYYPDNGRSINVSLQYRF